MVYPISITNFYTKSHTLWTLLPSIQNSSASQILIYTLPTSIWFAEVFLSYQGFFLFCFFALVGGERLIEIYNPFIPSHSTCALLSSLLSLSNHVHNFYCFPIVFPFHLSYSSDYRLLAYVRSSRWFIYKSSFYSFKE